jgi:hypothetical protein
MLHLLGVTAAIVLAGALMGSPGAVRLVRSAFPELFGNAAYRLSIC